MELIKIPGSDQSHVDRIIEIAGHLKSFEGMLDCEELRAHMQFLNDEALALSKELDAEETAELVRRLEELGYVGIP